MLHREPPLRMKYLDEYRDAAKARQFVAGSVPHNPTCLDRPNGQTTHCAGLTPSCLPGPSPRLSGDLDA